MYAVEFINENMDARKVLEYYKFEEITESEEYIRAKCKIHGGDNPTAFCWNKRNNLWICYTGDCGGGDVFTLVEKLEKCNFTTAINKVAQILNLNINDMEIVSEDRIRKKHLMWLEKELKKRKPKTLTKYEMPYTKFSLTNENFKRFDEGDLFRHNAGFCKVYPTENGILYNKLAIPLYKNNVLVGCALRDTTGQCKPKWYYVPKGINVSTMLYNFDYIEENENITEIILVEGIFDVWAYERIGIYNVVAIFGSSLSEEQVKLLLHLNIDVTLSFDSDSAGKKATEKAIKLLKNKITLRKIELNEGCDPADMTIEDLTNAYLNRKVIT